jgi:hypothetical protein
MLGIAIDGGNGYSGKPRPGEEYFKNKGLISNFGVSVFSTKRMRVNSDGVGCGRESRGRSPTRSQAHSPHTNRSGAAGTAALDIAEQSQS